jgi:Rod binding domain-containing protein
MNLSPITSSGASLASLSPEVSMTGGSTALSPASNPQEVSRQFEAILMRQMLSESMKSFVEQGQAGQVYGYFITDALAETLTKAGGLGIRSVIEAQLRQDGPVRPEPPAPAAPPQKLQKPLKP